MLDPRPWHMIKSWTVSDVGLPKAPLATECTGKNPTDSGKNGRKRSLLTDGNGIPLSISVAGANVHDVKLLEPPLGGVIIPRLGNETEKNLCGDAGYKGASRRNFHCYNLSGILNY